MLLLSSSSSSDLITSQCSSLLRSFPSSTPPTWRPGTDCCRHGWDGVTCSPSTRGLLITSLDLADRNLSGPIGSSLFDITSLDSLNLAYNKFDSIPSSGFENLPNLTHLNLSWSFSSGQIPLGISRLTKLVSLDLSFPFLFPPPELKDPNFETLVRNLGSLRELYLDGVNISESVGRLARVLAKATPRLKVLSLSNCYLSGPIDPSLSKLSTLSLLDLSFNFELNAPVPEFLANFSSLTVLKLGFSGLQGLFPTNIFGLKSLTHIDLSYNPMLSGWLPNFAQGSGLESLVLSETNFSGNLPSSIGHLKSLKTLDLSYNDFTGSIPPSIRHLKSLKTLDLSSNNFSGSIPPSFGVLLHLTRLNLHNNSLSGQVPSSLFTHPSLQELELSLNKLSGQIQEFSNASSMLQFLDLSNNVLSGEVPNSVFQLSGLEFLNLTQNDFNGTIETNWFRGLKNLYGISLSYNSRLSVQVGDGNSSLPYPTLESLELASCNLTEVPSFLSYQNQIEFLDLSCNRISGAIPNWIWGIGRGFSLNLSHNQFTSVESPPLTFSKYSIESLDLHSNLLQGPIPIPPKNTFLLDYSNNNFSSIPANISLYLTSTIFFSLANNSIKGEIPQSICEARQLEVLDFSNNIFNGPIPPCLLEIDNDLNVLNLRNNRLRSTLPWNISISCGLRTLNLNGNRLEGKVPPSLTNCDGLEVLDMGNNLIEDSFPHWLGNISSLRVLVLRSNKFYGPFTGSTLGSNATDYYTFPVLQILDLSSNHFNDNLPLDFFKGLKGMMVDSGPNCSTLKTDYTNSSGYYDAVTIIAKGMEYSLVRILTTFTSIDLSDNGFTGNIPELIGELRYLHMLNLSQNALTDQIPASIGNMMQLESLDLSRNRFSGEIPQGLVSLTFLSFLNLSDNKLVGRIPQGNQLSTFSSASYQGNEGLCGSPLPKQCGYASPPPITVHSDDSDSTYVIGLALFTGLGYGVGIALVLVLQNVSLRRGRRSS